MQEFISQRNITEKHNSQNQRKRVSNYSFCIMDKLYGNGQIQCYKGINQQTYNIVMIKIIPNNISGDKKLLLANQISALKQLRHNHILKCQDIMITANNHYFVFQMYDDVLQRLLSQRLLSQSQAFKYFVQIFNGYYYIRQNGYLHCNISTKTIYLKNNMLKFSQFGHAIKRFSGSAQNQVPNHVNPYMAPQVLKQGRYSQKSDIWSIGAIFYQSLTGYPPSSSQFVQDSIFPQNLKLKKLQYSNNIWTILEGCLQYSYQKRLTIEQLKNLLFNYPANKNITISIKDLNNQIPSQQCQQKIQIDSILQNQLNYIYFLQKIQKLLQKCNKITFLKNLSYLNQYVIRMRFNFIKNNNQIYNNIFKQIDWNKLQKKKIFEKTAQQIKQLSLKYQKQISYINNPYQPRLQIFKCNKYHYKQQLILQYQAILRNYIQQLMLILQFINTQQDVLNYQNQILLLDFLLTSFQLNSLIIQYDGNQPTKFAQHSYLNQIIQAPVLINLYVFQLIKQKYKDLQF